MEALRSDMSTPQAPVHRHSCRRTSDNRPIASRGHRRADLPGLARPARPRGPRGADRMHPAPLPPGTGRRRPESRAARLPGEADRPYARGRRRNRGGRRGYPHGLRGRLSVACPVDNVRAHILTGHPWLAADPALAPWPEPADLDVVQTGAWILPDERPLPADLEAFLRRWPTTGVRRLRQHARPEGHRPG